MRLNFRVEVGEDVREVIVYCKVGWKRIVFVSFEIVFGLSFVLFIFEEGYLILV